MLEKLILGLILICNSIIVHILKSRVERKTTNLIAIIGLLPGIPLLWLMTRNINSDSNSFLSFYFPLIITLITLSILLINIIKVNKNR
ncbi:MAG: hypothetical protein ACTHWZ_08525 [Peptoniphilaceae bacterium]